MLLGAAQVRGVDDDMSLRVRGRLHESRVRSENRPVDRVAADLQVRDVRRVEQNVPELMGAHIVDEVEVDRTRIRDVDHQNRVLRPAILLDDLTGVVELGGRNVPVVDPRLKRKQNTSAARRLRGQHIGDIVDALRTGDAPDPLGGAARLPLAEQGIEDALAELEVLGRARLPVRLHARRRIVALTTLDDARHDLRPVAIHHEDIKVARIVDGDLRPLGQELERAIRFGEVELTRDQCVPLSLMRMLAHDVGVAPAQLAPSGDRHFSLAFDVHIAERNHAPMLVRLHRIKLRADAGAGGRRHGVPHQIPTSSDQRDSHCRSGK